MANVKTPNQYKEALNALKKTNMKSVADYVIEMLLSGVLLS